MKSMGRGTLFKAKSIKEAMASARQAFGDDAVILSVERAGGMFVVEAANLTSSARADELRASLVSVVPAAPKAAHTKVLELPAKEIWREQERHRDDQESGHAVERLERRFDDLMRLLASSTASSGQGSEMKRIALNSGFDEVFANRLEAGGLRWMGPGLQLKDALMRSLAEMLDELGTAEDLMTGRHALVGPTGSGKTTTLAKLAHKACSMHGSDAVGLITTDFYRIGAFEQLRVYGELLGVQVRPAKSPEEFASLMETWASKKLILVDTIGSARDDEKLLDQMRLFQQCEVKSALAVQSSLSMAVAKADTKKWAAAGASSAIVTKMDEAIELGAALQAVIESKLPVRYVTNGQKVPANLHAVSHLLLAHKAIKSLN